MVSTREVVVAGSAVSHCSGGGGWTVGAIYRSVILVNIALDINKWAQIPVEDSSDVSAIQLHTPKGHITIFNLYIDCNHSEAQAAT